MSAFLEIQNLTPFPMVWAQLGRARHGEGNLLAEPLDSRRGLLLSDVEPGPCALTCSFDVSRAGEVLPERVHGPEFGVGDGEAMCVAIQYERGAGFRVTHRDARRGDGARSRRGGDVYRWTPVESNVTAKA